MSSKGAHQRGIHYQVTIENAHAHLWRIVLFVQHPRSKQKFQLPVWIPGSYLVREFSKQLSRFEATQDGMPVAVKQLDKCTWVSESKNNKPLQLQYFVHAHDHSVRTAWLDAHRGFFNGTSMFVQVLGQTQDCISLELMPPVHTSR